MQDTRRDTAGLKIALPLGWQWSTVETIKLGHVRLGLSFRAGKTGAGKTWIYAAEIPQHYSLTEVLEQLEQRFPDGWCARGCSSDFLQHLGGTPSSQLLLGSSANIKLNGRVKNSVAELARRAARTQFAYEIECEIEAKHTLKTLRRNSRYAKLPALRHLFREGLSTRERKFAVRDSITTTPQAFVSLTQYGEHAWHTEILLRSANAPIGSMELLTTHIIATLRNEGFQTLSLGEVPFHLETSTTLHKVEASSKLERLLHKTLPPLLFPSFNIPGLYNFKNKFKPDWEPSYWVATTAFRASDMIWVALHSNCLLLICRNIAQKLKSNFNFLTPRRLTAANSSSPQ